MTGREDVQQVVHALQQWERRRCLARLRGRRVAAACVQRQKREGEAADEKNKEEEEESGASDPERFLLPSDDDVPGMERSSSSSTAGAAARGHDSDSTEEEKDSQRKITRSTSLWGRSSSISSAREGKVHRAEKEKESAAAAGSLSSSPGRRAAAAAAIGAAAAAAGPPQERELQDFFLHSEEEEDVTKEEVEEIMGRAAEQLIKTPRCRGDAAEGNDGHRSHVQQQIKPLGDAARREEVQQKSASEGSFSAGLAAGEAAAGEAAAGEAAAGEAAADAAAADAAAARAVNICHGRRRDLCDAPASGATAADASSSRNAAAADGCALSAAVGRAAATACAPETQVFLPRRDKLHSSRWLGAGACSSRRHQRDTSSSNPPSSSSSNAESGSSISRVGVTGDEEEERVDARLRVLPLYASLPWKQQQEVFSLPAADERILIVATNVAETSLTLPNIRYVIDSGREKQRVYYSHPGQRAATTATAAAAAGATAVAADDLPAARREERTAAGGSSFEIHFISQASALQRAGRAGRLGPGICYRLYSSAFFQHVFPPHTLPALLRTPLDALLLYMTSLGIPRVKDFPFPSPPPACAVAAARDRLVALGALEPLSLRQQQQQQQQHQHQQQQHENEGYRGRGERCTPLGRRLARLPIHPRYGKMLLLSLCKAQQLGPDCLGLCCLLAAALSIGEIIASVSRNSSTHNSSTHNSSSTYNSSSTSYSITSAGSKSVDSDGGAAGGGGQKRKKKSQESVAFGGSIAESTVDAEQGCFPWRQYNNDMDAYLWICGAYAHALRKEAFCTRFGLNSRRMREVYLLANQLASLLRRDLKGGPGSVQQLEAAAAAAKQHGDASEELNAAAAVQRKAAAKQKAETTKRFAAAARVVEEEVLLTLPLKPRPPSSSMRQALHECVLEALIDRVAVWIEGKERNDLTGGTHASSSTSSRGGYRCAESGAAAAEMQLASIHPSSNLALQRPRPRLLVYNSLLHQKTPFLYECLSIDAASLRACASPLIRPSGFLEVPVPTYDQERDAVIGWQKSIYSPLNISLPAAETVLSASHAMLYPCVAAAFLEGSLVPALAVFRTQLLVHPAAALAGRQSSVYAVRQLVSAFQSNKIVNRRTLVAAWKEDPSFLLSEYIHLQRYSDYERICELRAMWPPLRSYRRQNADGEL